MACAVESLVSNLPQTPSMEFRWKIRPRLEKSNSANPIMTTKELEAVKSLTVKKSIRILQADSDNCTVVLDESKYKNKLNTLLESSAHEPLPKDPTAKVERKI
jgi:hypothetical protein